MAILFAFPIAVLYRPYEDISRIYYGTDTRIFSLLLGTFLGFMQMHKRKNVISSLQEKRKILYFIMLIVITFFSFMFMEGQSAITYRGGMFAISIVFCFIIGLTVNPQLQIGKWLDSPPLLWIGKRSYEIYLWQYPVIFLFNYFSWNDIPFSPLIQFIIILIISSWLHYILSFEKFNIGGKNMKLIKKLSFMVITMVSLFTFCLGGCSIIIPQDSNYDSQDNLQKELERNSEELDKEQAVKSNIKKSEETEKEKAAKLDKKKSEGSKKEQVSNSDEQLEDSADSLDFITAIGDSVMLGAAPSLKKAMPDSIIDAKESRQVVKAKEIIDNLSSEEKLGRTVIIALGTNGPFSESKGQELIDQLGKDRTIYWITVYGKQLQWQDKSNSTIRKLAEENENVSIIDWENAVSSHSEWLYKDGIHLNSKGQAAYTDLIVRSISPQ
ncbi:acyltransferase family protein [Anaerocolumna jejuensis]|uniref:acyltransferase family protein n=1 Tax=Anaerocolumna jejuensis TaxID=259063 RepID=UPI003F7B5D82